MSLLVASINVNGLRDTKKRNYSFLWLIEQKYDCVCIQETIVLIRQLKMKKKEWKTIRWRGKYLELWI
jgi:exonuclease III